MEQRLEHHTWQSVNSRRHYLKLALETKKSSWKRSNSSNGKKADRNGGLREVQKKEDLLKRIASLEKMEGSGHRSRALAARCPLKAGRHQRLKGTREQRSERLEERELHLAISETGSFEKEELLVKVEKLESKLEGRRNGAVLIKMKIAVLEGTQGREKKHGRRDAGAPHNRTPGEPPPARTRWLCAAQEKA
jgi:hypothetical protein